MDVFVLKEVIYSENCSLGQKKCPSYGGVRLTFVRLIEIFLRERQLISAGTCETVRLREVSVLWDVRLKRFYYISSYKVAFKIKSF